MSTLPTVPASDIRKWGSTPPSPMSRVAHAWRQLGAEWKLALTLLLSLRIGLGLIGFLSMQLQPGGAMQGDWLNLIVQSGKPWSYVLSVWQRWDSLWYQEIATNGYQAGNRSVHFEPLYPFLSHIVSLVLGGQVVIAQLLVSSSAFVLAMVLLYRVVRLDATPAVARLTVILTALFPMGFFLVAPYTESVYLLMTLAAIWFSRQGRPWMAGLAGFGVGLARWVGVFIAFALAVEYVQQRREGKRWLDLGLLSAGMPVLAVLAMMIYSQVVVGERLSEFNVNDYWGIHSVPPWQSLGDSWAFITSTGSVTELVNLACLIGFTALLLGGIRRIPWSYTAYAAPYLFLLFCRESAVGSPLIGVARYALVLFPCFIIAALWLKERLWTAATWLVLSVAFQAILFLSWLHWVYLA